MILKLSPPRCVICKEWVQQNWIGELWFRKQLSTCLFVWTLNYNSWAQRRCPGWPPIPLSVGLPVIQDCASCILKLKHFFFYSGTLKRGISVLLIDWSCRYLPPFGYRKDLIILRDILIPRNNFQLIGKTTYYLFSLWYYCNTFRVSTYCVGSNVKLDTSLIRSFKATGGAYAP